MPVYDWAADALNYLTALDNFGDDTFPNADLRFAGIDYTLDTMDTTPGFGADDGLPDAFLTQFNSAASPFLLTPSFATPVGGTDTTVLGPIDNDGNGRYGLSVPQVFGSLATDLEAVTERYREAFLPAQGKINLLDHGCRHSQDVAARLLSSRWR